MLLCVLLLGAARRLLPYCTAAMFRQQHKYVQLTEPIASEDIGRFLFVMVTCTLLAALWVDT